VFESAIKVAFQKNVAQSYPAEAPYSPQSLYAEYPFVHLSQSENLLYPAIRKIFLSLGYDKENFGHKKWNPLGKFVEPGQKVVIKPNWVLHENMGTGSSDCMITHPALIRVVVDYVVIALRGEGTIIVGDAPIQSADFSTIVQKGNLKSIKTLVEDNTAISFIGHDWRDAGKFVSVNLRHNSFLDPIADDYLKFRVTNYDKSKMLNYHNDHDHIYVIHKSILTADAS